MEALASDSEGSENSMAAEAPKLGVDVSASACANVGTSSSRVVIALSVAARLLSSRGSVVAPVTLPDINADASSGVAFASGVAVFAAIEACVNCR